MSDNESDDDLRNRLATRRTKVERRTITHLVAQHLPQILEAHQRARSEGKTWSEIGRDLRPEAPVPGNTISKVVGRLLAKADAADQKGADEPGIEASSPPPQADGTPAQLERTANPFRRKVDPLRTTGEEAD